MDRYFSGCLKKILVIHGGAGMAPGDLNAGEETAARAALVEALRRGHAELAAGKSVLGAVTARASGKEETPAH